MSLTFVRYKQAPSFHGLGDNSYVKTTVNSRPPVSKGQEYSVKGEAEFIKQLQLKIKRVRERQGEGGIFTTDFVIFVCQILQAKTELPRERQVLIANQYSATAAIENSSSKRKNALAFPLFSLNAHIQPLSIFLLLSLGKFITFGGAGAIYLKRERKGRNYGGEIVH
ncbi:hypothetical protein ACTXT7_001704 [Hymenolepis weldensis]